MVNIALKPCVSSSLSAQGYDATTKTLAVQFKANGPVYHFHDVPEDLYGRFTTAHSFGRFFQEHIKDKFKTTKIEPHHAGHIGHGG